ncbi:Pr6Pr family membrane protein [Pseudomonas sp. R5(2019)]|uniref:Pr6Pr family membrane protein n=1 Tax=Pseudomonas sp. R5(2019) TaxID=2697566 RepID=UPI0014123692|nr:Pr6Pr family membrane protein [Pseudomonas sp. R5(2019)]NBA94546.1 hypothetical protein [Pseudomonas sp. R5(2019)]
MLSDAPHLSPRMLLFIKVAAGLGWLALVIQLYLIFASRLANDASLLGGLLNFFSYFTILTNTLVATALTHAAFGREGTMRRFFLAPWVVSGITVSIIMVALTYSLLLRHLWDPQGLQWLADGLLHDVMPLLFVVYWWLCVPKGTLRVGHLLPWALYPLVYFAYALMRGHWIGVYPYPFIDVGTLGYGRVMVNALVILLVFLLLALMLIAVDRWQGRRLAVRAL